MRKDIVGLITLAVLLGAALAAWYLGAHQLATVIASVATGQAILPAVWRKETIADAIEADK